MRSADEGPVAEFCAGLSRLQHDSGLKRGALARRLGYSRSQLYEILDGQISRPPDWERFVEPLVRACTANDERAVEVWRRRHGVLLEVHAALKRHVRRDHPPTRMVQALPPCPYRGLSAFREQDAAEFFGREELTDRLVGELERKHLVALIGPSGSGKSSLVFAGAVPRLRKAGWAVAALRPGGGALTQRGIAEVAERILGRQDSARLLLVVDQFEELYAHDPTVARGFIDVLLAAVARKPERPDPPLTVVLTLRADFLGQALEHADLAEAIQDSTLVTGRMTRSQLCRAIEAPLPRPVRYESGLVERILSDVGDQPGHLALLEFALTALWERQQDHTLTHAVYGELGGVAGALTNYAEEIYRNEMEASEQQVARLFRQLVRPGGPGQPTRRVTRRTDLDESLWQLAQRLATTRLVVTGQDDSGTETVELAHESLISGWDRLHQWVEADRDFRSWQERLRTAMEQYRASGRDGGALLRGVALAEAQRWLTDRAADLSPAERHYIHASRTLQGRTVRRLRSLVAGLVVVLLLAVGLGVSADRQRRQIRQQELLATSRALAAQADAIINDRPVESILLSLQAFNEADTAEARGSLLRHAVAHRRTNGLLTGHTDRVSGVAFSPDGRTIATGSVDASVRLWDVATHRGLAVLTGHTDRVSGVAFSSDGRTMASASDDNTVRLWDVPSRRLKGTLVGHVDRVRAVAFSPDGRTLASASVDGIVRLWDVAGGRDLATLTGHTGWVRGLAFAPDGRTLATAGIDRTVRLWDVIARRELATLTGHGDRVRAVAFGPDGRTLASASDDRTARLWDVTARRELATLTGHSEPVSSVGFSPDGRTIATAGQDDTVRVWDVADRRTLAIQTAHADWITGVAFSPDGRTMATASQDHTVRVWDIGARQTLATLTGHTNTVTTVAFSPDGRTLATTGEDVTVRLWGVAARRELAVLTGHTGGVTGVAFSPDGRTAATTSADRTVRLWDVAARRELAVLTGHTGTARGVAFSPDGRILATASYDRTVRLWDIAARRELAVLTGHTGWASAVAFSPDGRTLASGSDDRTVRLWDIAARRAVATLTGHSGWVSAVAFSPDGRTLVTGSQDATVRVWDVAARREMGTLTGHTGWVWAVAVSPDGRTAASGSDDRTVRVWDVTARRELAILTGHTGWVLGAAFSPDARTLATASQDHTASLWDMDIVSWQRRLCDLAGRNLTRQEWDEFLPERAYRKTCPDRP